MFTALLDLIRKRNRSRGWSLEQERDRKLAELKGRVDLRPGDTLALTFREKRVDGSERTWREHYDHRLERRQVIRAPDRRRPVAQAASRPRERRVRSREQRRTARTASSRGDPDEPEPPLEVIPLARFQRELERAFGGAA
jgi:hypothetical protein